MNHLLLFAQQAGLLGGHWLSPFQAQITAPGPYKNVWMSVWKPAFRREDFFKKQKKQKADTEWG